MFSNTKSENVRLTQKGSFQFLLIEIGPLSLVITSLWIKLIYFSLSLRYVWWASVEPLEQWIKTHANIFSATMSSLFLLFALIALFPRIWRYLILLTIDLFITTIIVADMIYLGFYGDVISMSSLLNAHMLPSVLSSIIELLRPFYAIFYIDIIVGFILFPFYAFLSQSIYHMDSTYKLRLCVVLLLSGLILSIPTARLIIKDKNGMTSYTTVQREICAVIGLLPYHFFDAVNHLANVRNTIGNNELQIIRKFYKNHHNKQIPRSKLFGIAREKNVIVIIAESLQSFPIGLVINGQPVTPRLSEFIKESMYFVNFYDQTHLGTTADAEFISFQSLYPLAAGVVASNYKDNRFYGLPAILSKNGYETLSMVAEPGDFWHMNKMHQQLGFRHSYFGDKYDIVELIGEWLSDREFFIQSVPILEAQNEPFMAYLLSSSNHYPFNIPDKYRKLNLGNLEGTILGDYLHSVHYFDQAFGEFIDKLKVSGLLNRSIVVLYGDHKSFIGNSQKLANLVGLRELNYHDYLVLRKKIPFIIRLPYGENSGILDVNGGHIDIAPTILSLLGIDDDSSVMLGRDLSQGKNSIVVFRDLSFVDGTKFFINRFGPISNSECFNIETGKPFDCKSLDMKRSEALEQLEISDLIIRYNLIPILRSHDSSTTYND